MARHVLPQRVYMLVFITLLLLTLVTVEVAFLQLGWLNFPVAFTIATGKALLVILVFMHVRYSSRLTWVFAGVGFFWLVILLAFTLSDVLTRGWLPPPASWTSAYFTLPVEGTDDTR
jgi:cytochrome c oxidase subunit 4